MNLEALSKLEISELSKAIMVYDEMSKARQQIESLIRKRDLLTMIAKEINEQLEEKIKEHKKLIDQLEVLIKEQKRKTKCTTNN